jgi:hypothetical protein
MKKFVLITLVIIIIALLIRNANAYGQIIKTVTGLFGKSFKAVTEVGDFK